MRDPHQLSSVHRLDPAYSQTERLPAAPGSSLYGGQAGTSQWLYGVGDVAAHLMAESRKRAFRVVHNIYHPGFFRPHNNCVYFSSSFVLVDASGAPFPFAFYHSGELRLAVNGRFFQAWPASDHPILKSADLRPFLIPGDNTVTATACAAGSPVCFCPLSSPGRWRCSTDSQSWDEPELHPFVTDTVFPHQERLPSILIPARSRTGLLYDFGVELIGMLGLTGPAEPTLHRFKAGESEPEAENPAPEFDEQVTLVVDRLANPDATSEEAALRFVRLLEGPAPEPADLQCHVPLHPAAYRGAFACSDPEATRIWMHAAYTLRLCIRDITVDGLKRDRVPWVGDLYLSQRCNACTFAEHGVFLQTLLAFYHENSDRNDFSGIFDYTLFWVIAAGEYYLYSGDLIGARLLWPRVQRVLDHLKRLSSPAGLLASEKAKWIFLDWADLPKRGNLLMIQSLYIQALEAAALLASAVGDAGVVVSLRQDAARLRPQVDAAFWNAQAGCYDDSSTMPSGVHGSRQANALAVLGGISNAPRLQAALGAARNRVGSAPSATPYMHYFECAALCRAGATDTMLAEVGRYWGGMLSAGATTFWEAYDERLTGVEQYAFYDRPFAKSLCHAWSAGPVALYSMELFDLRPLAPGWKQFSFSPRPTELTWGCVKMPTPQGDITAEFDGNLAQLEIPAHSTWVDPANKTSVAAEGNPIKITLKSQGSDWVPSLD